MKLSTLSLSNILHIISASLIKYGLWRSVLTAFLILTTTHSFAQVKQDSTKKLKEVIIRPYFSSQPLLRSTGSIGLADSTVLERQRGTSFVSTLNTISGLRMEERSPGSYRLSIRGSLLRSPFGVRNVKIYFDDFPLTDAGGNTYLNALDVAGTSQLQVLKGPHASIYGANSGGVILIRPQQAVPNNTAATLAAEGGSFGTFRENAGLQYQSGKYSLSLVQAYQQSDGYRDHSAMKRNYFQALQKWEYADRASLKALVFYSDLHYNTPGGLTESQYLQDPRLSRPAAGAAKSAIEQQAGIYSKTVYGGVSNDWAINDRFRHVISVFSSYTDFKNPFISNYEKRKEFTLGMRSYLEYSKQRRDVSWTVNVGLESMQTTTDFDNFDNNLGVPAAVQASDELKANSNFAFAHFNIDVFKRLLVEVSASANLYKYDYERTAPIVAGQKTKTFAAQLMPRIALSYLINPDLSVRASASKGYSPPTLPEVRASDNVVNVNLKPEYGWNYEAGFRYQGIHDKLQLDLTGFYYRLKSAIVRRVTASDAEYFVNAGGTRQLGLESTVSFWLIPARSHSFFRSLQLRNAATLSHFKFEDYLNDTEDFSGNDLTGVPKTTIVSNADLQLPKAIYIFLQHNYTSSIPLNDANTVYATRYHLVQAKVGWKNLRIANTPIEIYAGVDNLLNEKYSLGNDLNAFGGRYFNAAATRNFYGGLAVSL